MIPFHCLWAELNNRMHSQLKCGMTWFCFYLDFFRSHARYGCCSIVCWRGWGDVRLKLDVQGQGDVKILNVDGQKGWGVLKLDNFHGRHMCIVPYQVLRNIWI